MNAQAEVPAFEVLNPATGKAYRIYESGRTEGFEDASLVINRIPAIAASRHAVPKEAA